MELWKLQTKTQSLFKRTASKSLNTENLDNQLCLILKDDAITGYYYNKLSESGLSNIPEVLLMAEV